MLLTNQQKYIVDVLRQLKALRKNQLYTLVQTHYRTQGIEISPHRMEAMLHQLRTGSNFISIQQDLITYGRRETSQRYLEAIDIMLELTENAPAFFSCDRLHEPFLLRFSGGGEMANFLFSVAWLDIPGRIAATTRMKGERIIWICDAANLSSLTLPRHHSFAVRQEDGTHRFFGSTGPKKIQMQEE